MIGLWPDRKPTRSSALGVLVGAPKHNSAADVRSLWRHAMRWVVTVVVLSAVFVGAGFWIVSVSRERDQARIERDLAGAELAEANDKLARAQAITVATGDAKRQFLAILGEAPRDLNVASVSPLTAPMMVGTDLPFLGQALDLDRDVGALVGWSRQDAAKVDKGKKALADRLRSYESYLGRSTKRIREEGRTEDLSFFVRFEPGEQIDLDKRGNRDSMTPIESERHFNRSLSRWAEWLYANYENDEYKTLMYGVGSNVRGPHSPRNPKEGTFIWHYARGNWDFIQRTAK